VGSQILECGSAPGIAVAADWADPCGEGVSTLILISFCFSRIA
jgi:hypothetical protein